MKEKITVALAGNPNVGKSTLFNALTGGKQHTGNWTGKTVSSAKGYCESENNIIELVDLPGTYSLVPHSAEEEITRDYIICGEYDEVVVVCDALCLERNLNLVLQILEITERVVVCVNLMDEAEKRGVVIDIEKLSSILGVPVIGTVAKKKKSVKKLVEILNKTHDKRFKAQAGVIYPVSIEQLISALEMKLGETRGMCIKYLTGEMIPVSDEDIKVVEEEREKWEKVVSSGEKIQDVVAKSIVIAAEKIYRDVVSCSDNIGERDRRIDKILTGKITAYPIMILLLAFIFWLTIKGANYPSQLLSNVLFSVQDMLTALFERFNAPEWLHGALVLGVYRVLAWVVSVMLPPMAIFFPLFTLLEDVGYLPRIAYNLDAPFKKCGACGKQALTMW